jgi:hypothetical protein
VQDEQALLDDDPARRRVRPASRAARGDRAILVIPTTTVAGPKPSSVPLPVSPLSGSSCCVAIRRSSRSKTCASFPPRLRPLPSADASAPQRSPNCSRAQPSVVPQRNVADLGLRARSQSRRCRLRRRTRSPRRPTQRQCSWPWVSLPTHLSRCARVDGRGLGGDGSRLGRRSPGDRQALNPDHPAPAIDRARGDARLQTGRVRGTSVRRQLLREAAARGTSRLRLLCCSTWAQEKHGCFLVTMCRSSYF